VSVRKAVIPAAGLGTRFLPATKAIPKEMLPIVDVPTIQYVVDEAIASGIEHVVLVTGRGKDALVDHFDRAPELEQFLAEKGKDDLLAMVRDIAEKCEVIAIRQKEPRGLGHAVLAARPAVGDEPFAVLLGDDIMVDDSRLLRSMLDCHERYGRSVVAVLEVARNDIKNYWCVSPEAMEENLVRIRSIVEKPKPEDAPSNLAVIGRYVFTPEIFDALDRITPGAGGELQLTDAISLLLQTQTVFGYSFETGRYDIGKKIDFLRATVELALDRPDLGDEFKAFLADLVQRRKIV